MYRFIDEQPDWNVRTALATECKDELRFWLNNLEKGNGFKIKIEDSSTKILYTDASSTG